MLGGSLWIRGRMAESGEVLDGAIAAARLVDNVQGLAWNLFNRSYAAFAAGDIDLALATAEEAFDLSKELDEGPVPAHAAAALAYALLETGHAERAAELLVTKAGGDELRLIGGGWRAGTSSCSRAVFWPRANARKPSAPCSSPGVRREPWACRWRSDGRPCAAVLELDAGDPTSAAAHALAAAAALQEIGNAFDAATSRALAGERSPRRVSRTRAAAEFELAAAAFDSFGSIRYRDEAERELRKLGRPTPRRSRPGGRTAPVWQR